MLMFNGKPLPVGVRLLGYTAWSPEVDLRTIDIPSQRGVMWTGSKIGPRSIRVELVIEANNSWEAATIAANLRAWCMSGGPAKLKLPRLPHLYLMAECETYPAPDMAKSWEAVECSFRCFRPEFFSEAEFTAEVPASIVIGGNVSTPLEMTFTLASEATDPEWTVDDYTIALSGTVSAGTVTIYTDPEKAKVVTGLGEDITAQVTLASDLAIMLDPGTHTITAPEGVTGTAKWRNRYI